MRTLYLLAVLSLSGCFYIGNGRHQDELDPDGDGRIGDEDCAPYDEALYQAGPFYADTDGDGFGDESVVLECGPHPGFVEVGGDCDDADVNVNPDAPERCDGLGIDEDCDGQVDDADDLVTGTRTFYVDLDGDGFGADTEIESCAAPEGAVPLSGDCDDAAAGVHPAAPEICNGIDDDCDEAIDDEDDVSGTLVFFVDDDGDGFGDPALAVARCSVIAGLVADSSDCDDANAHVNPAADEVCDGAQVDEDCDGARNESGETITYYADADGDGFGDVEAPVEACAQPLGFVVDALDCNDAHAGIHPDATEVCDPNDVDENCNGDADDDEQGPRIGTIYRADLDEDGFGDADDPGVVYCDLIPDGQVADGSDCDDDDPEVKPGAPETCDTVDNDCDGLIDDEDTPVDPSDWYLDSDEDGFGAGVAVVVQSCLAPSAQHVSSADDCDDADPNVNPAAAESCGGGDEDCDGLVDDADSGVQGTSTFYVDGDADGFGAEEVQACVQPTGAVVRANDCDDADPEVNPDALETCAAGDRNCDGADDAGAIDASQWFLDSDDDDFGAPGTGVASCSPISGRIDNPLDCDDTDENTNPDRPEVCGGGDDDCDGQIDDDDSNLSGPLNTFYTDADGDGFGVDLSVQACEAPHGFVSNTDDCNDGDAAVNPNGIEVCDLFDVDEDCSGVADDEHAAPVTQQFYYQDADQDGYGGGLGGSACDPPDGFVLDHSDCDDSDAAVSPARTEICDSFDRDEDCDGNADDDDPEGAAGQVVYFIDQDQDDFGDAGADGMLFCDDPGSGFSTDNTDCEDSEELVNPGQVDIRGDSIDSDCDLQDFVCGESRLIVPTYFGDIASAVTAACSGDAIELMPGTYHETQIDLTGKTLELDAFDAFDRPILDGQGSGPLFYANSTTTFDDLIFRNGSAVNGGCLEITGGSPTVEDSDFENCSASGRGGAVHVINAAPRFAGVTFSNNSADVGGAIAAVGGLDVEDCTFVDNTAVNHGGAVDVALGDQLFRDSTFTDNSAAGGRGGAIRSIDSIDFDVLDGVFDGNSAVDGGAILVAGEGTNDCDIADGLFIDNAASGDGGAIHLTNTDSWDLDIAENIFDGNIAGGNGGGLLLANAIQTDLDDLTFLANQAADGAAIHATSLVMDWDNTELVDNIATAGSVVSVFQATTDVRAIDTMRFGNNSATQAMLFLQTDERVDVMRVRIEDAPGVGIMLDGPAEFYNVLSYGAGDDHVQASNGSLTRFSNCTFADGAGAGINSDISGTWFIGNTIVSGNAIGLERTGGSAALHSYNDIFGNTTDFVGGGGLQSTDLSVDPEFVGGTDYHLLGTSPLVDAGVPTLNDPNGTRSDIGAYGGPNAI